MVPLLEDMVGEYRPALLMLTAAAALVLSIACINVAGLLLARGVTRQRMFAVCAALGAGRGRLVRQLLTESVALSLTGGVLGLAAAAVALRVVPALVPGDVARLDEVGIDEVTVAFTVCLSVLVGLLSGAVPALQWSRLDPVRTLNEGSARSAGGFRLLRSNRSRAALVTAQVALALVLLIGSCSWPWPWSPAGSPRGRRRGSIRSRRCGSSDGRGWGPDDHTRRARKIRLEAPGRAWQPTRA